MKRSWLAGLLCALGVACATPPPRIPFQDVGWHASALSGNWIVNKSFAQPDHAYGVELVLNAPGTGGWAFELGARYAGGDDDGQRPVIDPATGQRTLLADSEREIDFYEIDFGVRQLFREGHAFEPYFGVGGALIQGRTVERYVQPQFPPSFPTDTPLVDHERGEIRPGIYMRSGLIWNVLRSQVSEDSEFPVAFDVRGLLSVDYSYLEFSLALGFGR